MLILLTKHSTGLRWYGDSIQIYFLCCVRVWFESVCQLACFSYQNTFLPPPPPPGEKLHSLHF